MFLCLLPVIVVGIPAQTVHVVGPGGLPQISSALAIAAPGDIIHVLPGTYAPFSVSIGCTIRALVPGSVTVQGLSATNPVTIGGPPGQVVHLAGLDFAFVAASGVAITGGRVTLDQCNLSGTAAIPLVITNADVHLQGCLVWSNNALGFFTGMRATNARITAIDSDFHGSPAFLQFFYVCSPAIDATNTTLHATGCSIHAGVYGTGAVPGLRANGGVVWLSDCSVFGYGYCAVEATSVLADRCTLSQPAWANCSSLPSGGLLGVERPQPLQNGAPFSLVFKTLPNSYAAVFASQELTTLAVPVLHAQTQWIGPGVINLGVVLADASGHATASWNIPAGAWLIDQPLWFQGLSGFTFPLQLSPVAGGLIR